MNTELGSGIADSNSTHGRSRRILYRVLDDGSRITLDATNRTLTIDKTGQTGKFTAVASDNDVVMTLTGAGSRVATADTSLLTHPVYFQRLPIYSRTTCKRTGWRFFWCSDEIPDPEP